MNAEGSYGKNYSVEDIRKYLDGKLNSAEMYQLEKAAMEDPFLADAIEGLRESREKFGDSAIDSGLKQIEEKLSARVNQPARVLPMRTNTWWKFAAAAVVIITGGLLAYNAFLKEPNEQNIAVSNTKSAETETRANQPSALEPARTDTSVEHKGTGTEPSRKEDESHKNKIASTKNDKKSSASPSLDNELDKDKNVLVKEEKSKDAELPSGKQLTTSGAAEKPDLAKKEADNNADKAIAKSDDNAKPSMQRSAAPSQLNYFQGRVTDNNNSPIANATVQLSNQKQAVVTDNNGLFKLPSSDTSVQVQVNSVGFQSREFQLSNSIAFNEIKLDSTNAALNEVVVVGYGAKKGSKSKSNTKYPKVMVQDAEPVMGWVEFEQYLEKNKKQAAAKGEVVVSFQVNRKGELSDYKVEQSLSGSEDTDAIHLIKDGPPWRLKQGRKARVMVIVRY